MSSPGEAWLRCQKILDFQDHVATCQHKLVNCSRLCWSLVLVTDGSIYRLICEKLLGDHPIELVACTISNIESLVDCMVTWLFLWKKVHFGKFFPANFDGWPCKWLVACYSLPCYWLVTWMITGMFVWYFLVQQVRETWKSLAWKVVQLWRSTRQVTGHLPYVYY